MRRIWRKPQVQKEDKNFRVNEKISAPRVFLINEDGVKVGVVETKEALRMAEEAGFDLVEVNPNEDVPVVKIIDYGQFRYERDKKAHKQKVQQKKTELKGIRLSVRIGEHDFELRLSQAEKFLSNGDKLSVEILLRGRERQHPEKAVEVISQFYERLKKLENLNIIKEQDLTRQGGRFNMVVVNKK